MKNRVVSLLLSLIIIILSIPYVSAQDRYLTRGEVVEMLLKAADDYNPGVQKTDIIKGYEDGELREENNVTRAEALIMLRRAFGEFPELKGHNARVAIPAENFSDIPEWATQELRDVFDAGLVAGTDTGIFSPNENVTEEQMELFIKRVYSLFGTNLKDDFYAAVNKEILENLTINPGNAVAGTMSDLQIKSTENTYKILIGIIGNTYEKGTEEQKIADLYQSIVDIDSRNEQGIEPIKGYLDMIDEAETTDDLIKVQSKIAADLYVAPYMGFGMTVDLKDSNSYMLAFATISPSMPKEIYQTSPNYQIDAYDEYIKTLLMLGGESEEYAEAMSEKCIEMEAFLSEYTLSPEESSNVDNIYNIFTMDDIKEIFKDVDIDAVFADSELQEEEEIIITDIGLVNAFADYFNDDNVDTLKAYAKLAVLQSWGGTLNQEFTEAAEKYNQAVLGISGSIPEEQRALTIVQNIMPDYISKLYVENYFTEEAKQDVEKMVKDIIEVYRKRIENLTWMSDETKEKAIKKLDTMRIKIGYPDKWETYMDEIEIKSTIDGGSYFSNMLSIASSQREAAISLQGKPVDKSSWLIYPFTANACYSAVQNDITFPAAILQAPLYDVNASYEQNLGGIGYVIAHEITHAFDDAGAKFDENGNATDWWTEKDYEAFNALCEDMVEFYDGKEGVPGILMNGRLTLGENVADQGAVSCINEIVSGLENPDFETFYKSIANTWVLTASREYYIYASLVDTHSTEKLRTNLVVVNCDEFYETFDIDEDDGMWVAPEDRIRIW